MTPRRVSRIQNGEIPLQGGRGADPVPEGRIELGAPPEIDITSDQLGALLLERRRAMGLKVDEVAEDIKLKADYVRAIEREEFHLLPTPEYARLFIKSYAERLGFNSSEICALLDINVPSLAQVRAKDVAPPSAPIDSEELSGALPGIQTTDPGATPKMPRGGFFWTGVGLAVLSLGVLAWVILGRGDDPGDDDGANTSTRSPAETLAPPPVTEPVVTVPVLVPIAEADSMRFVLHFDRDTWASLTADGNPVARRVFSGGDSLVGIAVESFRLSLAHTGGVTATVNGYVLHPFREWTSRLEGYLITRDSAELWVDSLRMPIDARPVLDPETAGTVNGEGD